MKFKKLQNILKHIKIILFKVAIMIWLIIKYIGVFMKEKWLISFNNKIIYEKLLNYNEIF